MLHFNKSFCFHICLTVKSLIFNKVLPLKIGFVFKNPGLSQVRTYDL